MGKLKNLRFPGSFFPYARVVCVTLEGGWTYDGIGIATSLPCHFFKVYLLFESRHLWDTDELLDKEV